MGIYDKILKEQGLFHLKNRPEELRAEILKRLGLLELKDKPDQLLEAMESLLEANKKKLETTREDVGEKVMKALGREN